MRAVIVAALLACATAAHADERITDDTAYTTPEGKMRIGLWKLQYGIPKAPGLEVGTYTLPYLTWMADVRSVNGHTKYRFLDRGRWTLSGGLGIIYVDFANVDVPVDLWIVPVQLLGAVRLLGDRFTIGAGLMYTEMFGEGEYNEDQQGRLQGAVAVSNVQAWLSLTTRISRGWSFYLESRTVASTQANAAGDATFMATDRTRVDVAVTGSASVDELRGGSVLAAFQYSGDSFRIRFGGGYGNFNIPMLNFVTPVAIPFPELDLYWVF
jgi:hypothetical protein